MITMFKSTLLGRAPHWPGSMRWYLCSTYQALFLERGWVSLECWINGNQTSKKNWELTNCRKFLGICCQVVSIPSTSFPTGSLKFSLLHNPDIFIMSSIVYQNKLSFSKNLIKILNPAWLVTVFKDVCTLANCQNCETYVAQQLVDVYCWSTLLTLVPHLCAIKTEHSNHVAFQAVFGRTCAWCRGRRRCRWRPDR